MPQKMSVPILTAELQLLLKKHQALQVRIDEEMSRPLPNQAEVRSLKCEKLIVKDKLQELLISQVKLC